MAREDIRVLQVGYEERWQVASRVRIRDSGDFSVPKKELDVCM